MATYTVTYPPLNAIREAVYSRLSTANGMSGYNILKEGQTAASPFWAVTAAYLGSGGADPDRGINVVVQLEAYADAEDGGAKKVDTIGAAICAALSTSGITIDGYRQCVFTWEEATINTHQRDPASGELFAQLILRLRTILIT